MDINKYQNPLNSRYASDEMQYIFSPKHKYTTWRKLWYELAKEEKKLGLDIITNKILEDMKLNIDSIDFDKVKKHEIRLKHEVMAHIYAYGEDVPDARGIIHLGATSAYVIDNTDIIRMKEAMELIKERLLIIIKQLSDFSMTYRELPTLGFTHLQAAQLTTVGKRSSLWLQSIVYDFYNIIDMIDKIEFRGVKGTTGTQASFKLLFNDYDKVKKLDENISKNMGFNKKQKISAQTYDRKQDSFVLNTLVGIAESAHKFTNDIRILQHMKEIEEPFAEKQIGSSAMAYKRNPMRCERIASLSKYVITLGLNPALVSSTQWFERTLDDSANKRLSIPQAFLAIDSILLIWQNVLDGLVVYPKIIDKNIRKELPFMITENILMQAVKKGMDRQEVHEIIRELSMKEVEEIKINGKDNMLIEHIISDGRIKISKEEMERIVDPSQYIGYASHQVEEYINYINENILNKYMNNINVKIKELEV